jgi:hypothetical protein
MIPPEKFEKFLKYLRNGSSRGDAAAMAAIPGPTLAQLASDVMNGDEEAMLAEGQILAAEAQAADVHLQSARKFAEKSSKAHLELYKLMRPERFATKREVSVTHQLTGGPAPAQLPQATDAREKLFNFALQLFREEPLFWERAKTEMLKVQHMKPAHQVPELVEGVLIEEKDD